jgi:hypothetical protein
MPRTRPPSCNVGTFACSKIKPDPDRGGILEFGTDWWRPGSLLVALREGLSRRVSGRVRFERCLEWRFASELTGDQPPAFFEGDHSILGHLPPCDTGFTRRIPVAAAAVLNMGQV